MRCVGLSHTIIYYRYNHRCWKLSTKGTGPIGSSILTYATRRSSRTYRENEQEYPKTISESEISDDVRDIGWAAFHWAGELTVSWSDKIHRSCWLWKQEQDWAHGIDIILVLVCVGFFF